MLSFTSERKEDAEGSFGVISYLPPSTMPQEQREDFFSSILYLDSGVQCLGADYFIAQCTAWNDKSEETEWPNKGVLSKWLQKLTRDNKPIERRPKQD